jgi:hypothetical protein
VDRLQSFPNIWLRPPYQAYLGMANTIGIDRVVFTTDYVSIGEEEGEIVAHSTLVIVTQGVSPHDSYPTAEGASAGRRGCE